MDEKEQEEILYRLDERTKRVDDHLNRLDSRVRKNRQSLNNHDERISENENFLATIWRVTKATGAAMVGLVSGIGAQVAGILQL